MSREIIGPHPSKTHALSNYITRVVAEGVWPRFHSPHNEDVVTEPLPASTDQHNTTLQVTRERRRRTQERYRGKQKQKMVDLVNDCWQLQHEIQWLKQQQGEISNMTSAKDNPWVIAAQYFQVVLPNLLLPSGNPIAALSFLRATLSPNVETNAFASYWRVFGFLFPGSEVRLQRLDRISPNVLVPSTITKITITSDTLDTTFPHLSSDWSDPGTKQLQIAAKLLGQRLVLRGSVRFVWDNENCQIVDFQSQADMIPPILQVLGNIEDISFIFSEALITPDCNVVVERISLAIANAAWNAVGGDKAVPSPRTALDFALHSYLSEYPDALSVFTFSAST